MVTAAEVKGLELEHVVAWKAIEAAMDVVEHVAVTEVVSDKSEASD